MKLLLLAGLAYTAIGLQCLAKQDKDAATCGGLSQGACTANDKCDYVACADNPNGSACEVDPTCYWTGAACVDDTGCGVAPGKGKCNLKTDTDGYPCGFDNDDNTCKRRECSHSGGSKGWCLKYNNKTGPQCMFLSQKCWDLPSGQAAETVADNPNVSKGDAYCTSDRASKRVACTLKTGRAACEANPDDGCKFVDNSGSSGGGSPKGKCDVSGNNNVKAKKCNRKKMCKFVGGNCVEKTCADYSKNQFTCHFKSKKILLQCVMDGATCRAGNFSDADMIAKPCSDSTMKRVCHAQVKNDSSPRCEYNDDDGVCRDAQDKTCGDSNRKECRALKNSTPGEGCWWLGPDLRCLDKDTADCTILPRNRCKKVKKFKAHFNLACALNKDTGGCFNGEVPCNTLTTGRNCVEHANCAWTGTNCVDYASSPVTANSSDTCGAFAKKTCKDWTNNCFWSEGGQLCYVQPGANMP